MSHRIYTTEGVVLRRVPQEADCFYYILTKELGLIKCYAQAVREIKSKLRFALQEYSLLTVSFVKGRSGWRITSAISIESFYKNNLPEENVKALGNIASIITRLVHGEEKNENLYNNLSSGLKIISLQKDKSKDRLKDCELLVMLRILHSLGYVDQDSVEDLLIVDDFGQEVLDKVSSKNKLILNLVNKALKESQL